MIEICDIRFRWDSKTPVVLNIPSFQILAGELVFLEGPSGSGKTTLLNLLSGMVLPEQGSVSVNGEIITRLTDGARDRFRADHIGVMFQMFNLIPYLSSLANVTLPCSFSSRRSTMAAKNGGSLANEASRLLTRMQLGDVATINSPAYQLSIGQQQRVAAARSLIGSPELIIVDEPTSALDNEACQMFIKLLFEEVKKAEMTLIFISHDTRLAEYFDRRISLVDINQIA